MIYNKKYSCIRSISVPLLSPWFLKNWYMVQELADVGRFPEGHKIEEIKDQRSKTSIRVLGSICGICGCLPTGTLRKIWLDDWILSNTGVQNVNISHWFLTDGGPWGGAYWCFGLGHVLYRAYVVAKHIFSMLPREGVWNWLWHHTVFEHCRSCFVLGISDILYVILCGAEKHIQTFLMSCFEFYTIKICCRLLKKTTLCSFFNGFYNNNECARQYIIDDIKKKC